MRFLSVCSGIEAASVAWKPLGWQAVGFSEIEPFPCAVLAHHYPSVPNHGDMTRFEKWPDADFDVLVGGTPCQSFSVAGLRKGLADPRGNLMLTYGAIAARFRPEWLVWENVPGVLSSNGGRDFGTFLGMLAELGYGFAYRVLDAQFFGVAQRRRRVFVVANARDWRRAAAVLFERHSLSGNPAPRREAGKGTPAGALRSTDGGSDVDHARARHLIPAPHADISPALKARDSKGPSSDGDGDGAILVPMVAHSLRAEGFDASEDGTGRGTPIVPVGFAWQAGGGKTASGAFAENLSPTLPKNQTMAVAFADCFNGTLTGDVAATMGTRGSSQNSSGPTLLSSMAVRRLTPRECERLQGFPDDYTLIHVRSKPAADGPRYKALGNSMAVPVMAWIGRRIAEVSTVCEARKAA